MYDTCDECKEQHDNDLKESTRTRWAGEGMWFQIHTNGAVITFARFYQEEVPREKGDLVVVAEVGVFQKLQVDITTGTAEVFGREEFDDRYEASERLRYARDLGI